MTAPRHPPRFEARVHTLPMSAPDDVSAQAALLDTGAVGPREVVARIKSLLRRSQGVLSAHQPGLGFEVQEKNQQVQWCGQALPLTPVEFRLLRLLLSRPGQVYSRAHLLDCLHEDFRETSDRAIDSHVKNLRRKLEQAGTGDHTITSVYGVGYRYEKPD